MNRSARLVISMDSSTTACKAIAWDAQGNAVAEGRASYPLKQPRPGFHEQSAEAWWEGACTALRACTAQIDTAALDGMALTHQRESFVVLDGEGAPLRDAILWSDERSAQQVAWLERSFGREELHRLTGKPPSMTASIAKIVWLLEHEAGLMARAATVVDVAGFLSRRLTGRRATSLASADPMGLVDMAQRTWAGDLLQSLGLRAELLSELVEPGALMGTVTAGAAQATGLPAGLPLFAGAGDGQCAGLGANSTQPQRAYMNLGTAVASGAWVPGYVTDRAFRTLYAPVGGGYYVEHVLRGGIYTLAWFSEKFAPELRSTLLGAAPEVVLEAAAARVPPGSCGLVAVPYWNNVMSPYWDPRASGITVGWTGVHGREHFYRALLEGIAFEQRLVGDAMMAATGVHYDEYVTMGGGSRSALLCSIHASITGIPVVRSTTAEATCLGAGILAATGAGWYPDAGAAAAAMTQTAERFAPIAHEQAFYERLFTQVYRPLFPALQTVLNQLSELAREAEAAPGAAPVPVQVQQ